MLVVDDAPRLEERRPAAFPGAVPEVDVLDVHRREHRLVEAAEREELGAVVGGGAAAGEEHRVAQVLVEAVEVEERDRAEAPARVDLARLPARLRLVDEVDLTRHAERRRLLVERLEQRGDEVGLDHHVVVEQDDGRVPRLVDAAIGGAGEALVPRQGDHPHVGELRGEMRARVVVAAVVDDDDLAAGRVHARAPRGAAAGSCRAAIARSTWG